MAFDDKKRKFGDFKSKDSSAPRQKARRTSSSHSKDFRSRPLETRLSKLSDKQKAMQHERTKLPIYKYTSEIRRALHSHSVLLLVGETGSGKSTQVPQYLVDETWCDKAIAITQPRRVAATNLARRVADEHCTQLGEQVGYSVRFDHNFNRDTKIKYLTEGTLLQEILRDPFLTQYNCVILDEVHERSVDCDLLLGFLRRLVSDPAARNARQKRKMKPLRVVVMSATANVEELFDFFSAGFGEKPRKTTSKVLASPKPVPSRRDSTEAKVKPKIEPSEDDLKPGDFSKPPKIKLKRKRTDQLSDLLEGSLNGKRHGNGDSSHMTNGSTHIESMASVDDSTTEVEVVEAISDNVATLAVEGRQYPVAVEYLERATNEYVDVALAAVLAIHKREALPGDILVFLTGQDSVESLTSQLRHKIPSMSSDMPQLLPLPLFAALPRQQQQAIFKRPPRNTRKVIIATNIAETSLTIPGVRFVVDAGRVKTKEFRHTLLLDTLFEHPISKASATQRAGRAGREAPGKCYRLYTEAQFRALPDATTPELLRADLLPVVLSLRARGVPDLPSFPLLTPPDGNRMKQALARLSSLGAFDDDRVLTRTGKLMARLPLHPSYAKVIVAAAAEDRDRGVSTPHASQSNSGKDKAPALDPEDSLALLAVDTVAALQTDEPLALPIPSTLLGPQPAADAANEADDAAAAEATAITDATALQAALHRREGDHLTAHALLAGYAAARDKPAFCAARHLSARALRAALDARTQLRRTAVAAGLLAQPTVDDAAAAEADADAEPPRASEDRADALARCLLAGFWENVAVAGRDGFRLLGGARTRVDVHPSSVMWSRKVEAVVFSEVVYTARAYARGVSAVRAEWLVALAQRQGEEMGI